MPVTVKPAPHGVNAFDTESLPRGRKRFATDEIDLLKCSCWEESKKVKDGHIIESSFRDIKVEANVVGMNNGFVDGVVLAYNQHQHLIVRPDDVWLAILMQLNVYINANAEELRDMFVSHQGQKFLEIMDLDDIRSKNSTMFGVDWAKFAFKMTKMITNNIKDESLREWILPSFTTTTKLDQAVASIVMMSTLQKYFSYGCGIMCGLPSVTLLGEKSDWEKILSKVERLTTFGEEPTQWLSLLKPVLGRFVSSFDNPDSQETKDFWQLVVNHSGGGSGPTYLSGWITAFTYWSNSGHCYYKEIGWQLKYPDMIPTMGDPTPVLYLDGARYHRIETTEVPAGWASVPVRLSDAGYITSAAMVAGLVGAKISNSGENDVKGEVGLDTLAPVTGWWMYETTEPAIEPQRDEL